jgi:transposase InsO family protein
MSKRRLVVTAVLAGRSQSEVARTYGVSQGWISRLMARYRSEGEAAFELTEAGPDAGADTIGRHLSHHHATALSRATINRILVRAGQVTPDPSKRPKSSYIRFEAEQPNECWQSDFTHYGSSAASMWRSRPDWMTAPATRCRSPRTTGSPAPIVLATFRQTLAAHGIPAARPTTATGDHRRVQTLLEIFVAEYNHRRPHRSLPQHATPATIYTTLPKATPHSDRNTDTHDCVRHDKIDKAGSVTLRVAGQLRHIGIGRTYARTAVILLIQDLHVTVINAATGEVLRDLIIDPRRDYQPTGRPPRPTPNNN